MAERIVVELRGPDGRWRPTPRAVTAADAPASISSSDGKTGREVFMFGWFGGDGPCIWRCVGGIDVEVGAGRYISTDGLEVISDLAEPYELAWTTPTGTVIDGRFRVEQ